MTRSLPALASLAIVAGTSLPALAQTPAAHTQGVGFQTSWPSGPAFTYRRWQPDGWGLQVSTALFIAPIEGHVMKEFFRGDTLRAYGLTGVSLAYPGSTLGLPLGAGLDWFLDNNFALTFEAGYTLALNFGPSRLSFMPGGTIGLMVEW